MVYKKGYKHTEEWKKKQSERMKGKIPKNLKTLYTPELNEKRRAKLIGNKNSLGVVHSKDIIAKRVAHFTGNKHFAWKGDDVGYYALHSWLRRHKKLPKECIHCGKKNIKLQWANKSRRYKRDLNDWIALCIPCHSKYDYNDYIKKYRIWKLRKEIVGLRTEVREMIQLMKGETGI